MIGFVPLPDILKKLFGDYIDDEFGQISSVVFRLLDIYSYNHELLKNANSILEADTFKLCKQFKNRLEKGLTIKNLNCPICGLKISQRSNEEDIVRIFDCDHAFCVSCIGKKTDCCPICSNSGSKGEKKHFKKKQKEAISYLSK